MGKARPLPDVDFHGNPAGPGLLAWWRQQPVVPAEPALAPTRQPWAVAYSGGADSTALLLAAHALWPGQVLAFHVHHGLQAAADDFVTHAQAFCAALGVPLHVAHVQAAHQPGQSPEDAARQARYQSLAALAQQHGAAGVLLGQHAQDQVETLLLALSRGAGLPGLAAMPPLMTRHGVRFGRPLLAVDGQSLRDWLDAQQQPYLHDPTNTDERYTRNRIRARLLPVLAQAFPAYADTFARSARHAAQAQQLLEEVAQQDWLVVGNPPRILALRGLSRARQANVLRHWLRQAWQAAPSEAQLNAVLDQIAACSTRGHRIQLKVADGRLERDGPVLRYTPSL
ncbi:MAG TPA: tRNA lysidine(34) synthetase TilS [Macromonas sp.]|nr:tRNA lysidine(34) synthetase TilS [Macromonas sp.]